jgi:hypothetical protein
MEFVTVGWRSQAARGSGFAVLLLLQCGACAWGVDDDDVLSIPVSGTVAMDMRLLNSRLLAPGPQHADASPGPVELAARLWRVASARRQVISAKQRPSKTEYELTIVRDGIPDDDSVAGHRYTIVMSQRRPGEWTISSARESWRCWPGRGHQDFSVKPCT